ncbi:hypothetical protein PDIG_89080 [Penicillium digitatum PHI26]|uniref:Uncharacterized protein n=2 Tax=Penicillium digitatum TaxID=36651 RepID=K9FTS8_PEND2|nr:hypothetical protein PDIP_03350 [Penicillium digitatum Pd1]EKV04476.1 hypothetical protein PDIG_89080 [Penicillium digitatum PHI26]EKV21744.1 hypothetical protein PDIP_03350 [Penicillium digitatum Pd1]
MLHSNCNFANCPSDFPLPTCEIPLHHRAMCHVISMVLQFNPGS